MPPLALRSHAHYGIKQFSLLKHFPQSWTARQDICVKCRPIALVMLLESRCPKFPSIDQKPSATPCIRRFEYQLAQPDRINATTGLKPDTLAIGPRFIVSAEAN